MAYFPPVFAASIIGMTMTAVSFALPAKLSDPSLPPSLFAELDSSLPTPQLAVSATKRTHGWRLHFATENWVFSDVCGPATPTTAQGHAHVYVGDIYVGTATMPFFDIDELPENSTYLITVSLRAPDHRILVSKGNIISAEITLDPNVQIGLVAALDSATGPI